MFLSTLKELPNENYEIVGEVRHQYDEFNDDVLKELENQAKKFGGNAVIDFQIIQTNYSQFLGTGTAVKVNR